LKNVLDDVLGPDLRVVFCGMAAGSRSAKHEHYYAHRGNRFWQIIQETGLTPKELSPREFRSVKELGIGLTDLVKTDSGSDKALKAKVAEQDRTNLSRKIASCRPRVLAFNGKQPAKQFLGRSVEYGLQLQSDNVGNSMVFVLPSTSSVNWRWPKHKCYWFDLARHLKMRK